MAERDPRETTSGAGRPKPGERPRVSRSCPCCGGTDLLVHFTYDEPSPNEGRFEFAHSADYWREIHRCQTCGHFYDWHEMDQSRLYDGDYVSTTYGDLAGLRRNFERINSLPVERSDNSGRVRAVLDFAGGCFDSQRFERRRPSLLDVGSGLCVFAYRMQQAGWDCTVIDLDERQIQHARETAGVRGTVADVQSVEGLGPFDLITFNKVLEHVEDPLGTLAGSRRLLAEGGFVYVEVPDGETACRYGQQRQEFFLGHIHVFSARSLELLAGGAGFDQIEIQRLQEPSGKYTLRGFLKPR